MKTKIEIKSVIGKVLFVYECEDNSVKKTAEQAVKQNVPLCGANLYDADLRYIDLRDAELRYADLCYADLCGANLRDANLRDAELCYADLRGADLRGAVLCYADLYGADLRYVDLCGADLRGADLRGADLRGARNIPFIPLACPSDGAFLGWKKVNGCLVKLLIPEDAKRSSATTNKCRCDKAKVLEITNLTTKERFDEITNKKYAPCVYKAGEMVYPNGFDDDRWDECSNGIHFFIDKQEAVEYCD